VSKEKIMRWRGTLKGTWILKVGKDKEQHVWKDCKRTIQDKFGISVEDPSTN
jgi:hypothetical protein